MAWGTSFERRRGQLGSGVAALTALATLGALNGCGGGGGGGGGGTAASLGLQVPSQMSVITTTGTAGAMHASSFAATSDYKTDPVHVHVYDSALDPINQVNSILCMLSQTRYADMVNLGDYLAEVDMNKCESGGDPSANGQAGTTTQLTTWTVNSSRASFSSPEIVKCWVPQDEKNGTIRAKLTIDQGVSAANPFGVFHLNYASVDNTTPDVNNPMFHGSVSTRDAASGSIGFDYFDQDGDTTVDPGPNGHAERVQASVDMAPDHSTGVAHIVRTWREHYQADTGEQVDEYLLAFNDQHLLKQVNGGATVAQDRTATTDHVWQYNLYYDNGPNMGQRVELNGGFSFQTQSGDYGYIGYYGMWAPPNVAVNDGDTITKATFGDTAPTQYTMRIAPGKLYRYTQNALDLGNLTGLRFEWFDMTTSPPARVHLAYQNAGFEEVESFDPNSNSWVAVEPPVHLDTAQLGFLSMYSQQLNGPVYFRDGDAFITYYSQDAVKGDDPIFAGGANVDLYGFFQCLDAGISGANADLGNIYINSQFDLQNPCHYQFDQSDLTLYLDTSGNQGLSYAAAGLAPGEHMTGGPNFWGMRGGPMVTDISGFTSPFDLFSQTTFYVYETGDNPWNKLATVVDGQGAFVNFDHPIEFLYTHQQANDRNNDGSHAGETYFLSYSGAGQLQGLPYGGLDLDNDGNVDRFYPLVNLVDDLLVGPNGTEYVVKAVEMEQTLAIDLLGAPELDLLGAAALVVPDGSTYVTPDNGATPVVTDPPAVIAGELQGSLNTTH